MKHLTITEVAKELQLSVATVKRYIYDGRLKSVKLPGGQHRIAMSEVERLLAQPGEEEPHHEHLTDPEERIDYFSGTDAFELSFFPWKVDCEKRVHEQVQRSRSSFFQVPGRGRRCFKQPQMRSKKSEDPVFLPHIR